MPSSLTYAVIDPFDEDEFPDVPPAPAALLAALRTVPDPRDRRGRRHGLVGILALAACAVIAGARSFVAIAQWSTTMTPAAAACIGVTGELPSESTIRRTLNRVDGNGLDDIIGARAALRPTDPKQMVVIAVDGNTVRGSASDGGPGRHLLAALAHASGIVHGQRDVDKTIVQDDDWYRPLPAVTVADRTGNTRTRPA